jgi:DNA-binding MarR family transcriptional regulator
MMVAMSTHENSDAAAWGRRLSTAVVMFHEAVGQRLGISGTDQRALALIAHKAPLTAGALAQLTGLTPGAVTGLVDRLERAGYVRRGPDPQDRRRVLIAPAPGEHHDLADVFAELGRDMAACMEKYDERELAVIADYVATTIDVLERRTRELGAAPPG